MAVEQWIGLALGLVGGYGILAGTLGLKWTWRGRRIRWLVTLVGQVGTRITYVVVGLLLVGAGVTLLLP